MQERVRVVVMGGDIHRAGLVHHATRHGWPDVLPVDEADLSSGSTRPAAGRR